MAVDLKTIKNIIKECKKQGVSRLKVGEIEIDFAEKSDKVPVLREKKVKDNPEKREEIERETLEKEELSTKDSYVENLLLEDPTEYERLMMQGELNAEAQDSRPEQALQ